MNSNNKTYELLLKKLLFSEINKTNFDLQYYNIDINDFKNLFIKNLILSNCN